jgi:ABC-2 type transport system permease protein
MVGALSGSMQEGPQYAVIFTLPAAIPFYFFSVFLSTPDGPIPVVFSLFPLTASLSMVMRMVLSTVPAWQIGLSLGLLALADVGMMWLAGRLFRVQILLAGQTPRLRDLPKLVRG